MSRQAPFLLIRSDAGGHIGMGHVMRCLALAQAWRHRNGPLAVAMAHGESLVKARLQSENVEVVSLGVDPGGEDDARQTGILAAGRGARWIVADGYQFGAAYQKSLRLSLSKARCRFLSVDDFRHASHYYADAILDQNIGLDQSSIYDDREHYTSLLAGARYVMLRREFQEWQGFSRQVKPAPARKILVTLGGGNADAIMRRIVKAISKIGRFQFECKIVIGPGCQHLESLESIAAAGRQSITLLKAVADMAGLMAWADMAVSGAGSTAWELAFMGVPALLVILAENQEPVAQRLDREGAARSIGWHSALTESDIAAAIERLAGSPERRMCMSAAGQRLIDGKGAERVAEFLDGIRYTFRPARESDCERLWKLANDPTVRDASFNSEPIEWESHVRWFREKIKDPNCVFQVVVDDTDAVMGQIRYDITGAEAVVSISLDERFRGAGLGSSVIRSGADSVFHSTDVVVIHAYTRATNTASQRAFDKAGFVRWGDQTVQGQPAAHLVLKRERTNGR